MIIVYWAGIWGAESCHDDDDAFDCAKTHSLNPAKLDRGLGPLTALSIVIFAFTAHAQARRGVDDSKQRGRGRGEDRPPRIVETRPPVRRLSTLRPDP